MNKPFELSKFEKPARSSFSNLLESSKLSRLPSLPKREVFATTAGTCNNCLKRLDDADHYQTAVGFCKACLRTYAVVGVGVEKYTESKIRRHYQEDK